MNTTDFLSEANRLMNLWDVQGPNEIRMRSIMESALYRAGLCVRAATGVPLIVGRPPEKRDSAVEFMRSVLANGPVPSKEVHRLAAEAGHVRSTLARAKKRLGVKSKKRLFEWDMYLPPAPTPPTPNAPAPDHPIPNDPYFSVQVRTVPHPQAPQHSAQPHHDP